MSNAHNKLLIYIYQSKHYKYMDIPFYWYRVKANQTHFSWQWRRQTYLITDAEKVSRREKSARKENYLVLKTDLLIYDIFYWAGAIMVVIGAYYGVTQRVRRPGVTRGGIDLRHAPATFLLRPQNALFVADTLQEHQSNSHYTFNVRKTRCYYFYNR
jgi:hypothetical protein